MGAKRPRSIDRSTLIVIASIIAIGGIIYELMLSTATSYLLGDSTKSYSLGTGLSLFGMGVGSFLAVKFFKRPLLSFMSIELILSILGGTSIIILYAAYGFTQLYWLVFVVLTVAIGILIGFEIPLVMEIYKQIRKKDPNIFLTRLLAADYIGALVGSLLFPFLLLPYFGLIRSAIVMGIINLSAVIVLLARSGRGISRALTTGSICTLALLTMLFFAAGKIERGLTATSYQDEIVYFQTTPYQKIVMTKRQDDVRLYLNDQLQFSSRDEARYHEVLVHSAMTKADNIQNILILGGGDGLAAREVLKYPGVKTITDVDIDPSMTRLAKTNWQLKKLNQGSFSDPKVTTVNDDAEQFIRNTAEKFDVVIVDLVDPANDKVARLFSTDFYREIAAVMSPGAAFVTQATSTYFTPNAFWVISNNVEKVFGSVTRLSVNVPSFGEWGFVLSAPSGTKARRALADRLHFVDATTLRSASNLSAEVLSARHDKTSSVLSPTIHTIYSRDMSRWTY